MINNLAPLVTVKKQRYTGINNISLEDVLGDEDRELTNVGNNGYVDKINCKIGINYNIGVRVWGGNTKDKDVNNYVSEDDNSHEHTDNVSSYSPYNQNQQLFASNFRVYAGKEHPHTTNQWNVTYGSEGEGDSIETLAVEFDPSSAPTEKLTDTEFTGGLNKHTSRLSDDGEVINSLNKVAFIINVNDGSEEEEDRVNNNTEVTWGEIWDNNVSLKYTKLVNFCPILE